MFSKKLYRVSRRNGATQRIIKIRAKEKGCQRRDVSRLKWLVEVQNLRVSVSVVLR